MEGNDDAAEGAGGAQRASDSRGPKKKEKSKGQNFNRNFGSSKDDIGLCQSRAHTPEFSPAECRFGSKCKFEHDLRKYLEEGKRKDLTTFDGVCPVWKAKGKCHTGWKCRFVGSHMAERDRQDGRKELVLLGNESGAEDASSEAGALNTISTQSKMDLFKKKFATPKSDEYSQWLEQNGREINAHSHREAPGGGESLDSSADAERNKNMDEKQELHDNRARYTEPPFLPSEKRRIYFGPETPVLAPLTTQGNLPFRRLCIDLGAQITYSEMAMSMPLIQGQRSEWALVRAHKSEAEPPTYNPAPTVSPAPHYDNARDLRFGAQIAANKPSQALKATEILTRLTPYLRVIDLNCGCPIDLVYRTGAGSALLDSQSKIEKMVRGMNAVSGEIPITVKIRMGTKDHKPTAEKLIDRLVFGDGQDPTASGTAAITLHGRSRQQRYTKNADWAYIASCAALIERLNSRRDALADTIRAPDPREQSPAGHVYFIGNGDIYSHTAYTEALASSRVSSIMLARGALVKPWLFEEIVQGQDIDKPATERLDLVGRYVRYGLETWGSDEVGVGATRRFLLEWLSFAHRYVPVGILEYLPPSLQDRPPAWRGRNELETLLASPDYRDWIKIRSVDFPPPPPRPFFQSLFPFFLFPFSFSSFLISFPSEEKSLEKGGTTDDRFKQRNVPRSGAPRFQVRAQA